MKKILLLSFIILFTALSTALAQPAMRMKAHRILKRTAMTLHLAQKELKAGKNYTGDFAKAVAHQRFARKLFIRRNFVRAAHHSKMARMLAFRVIRANKQAVPRDMEFNSEEKAVLDETISDQTLHNEMMKSNSNVNLKDDEVVDAVLSDVDMEDIIEEDK